MTPEELETAVRAGDTARCAALLANAPESERRQAAPTARQCFVLVMECRVGARPLAEAGFPEDGKTFGRIWEAAGIALAGTATLAELKGLGWRAFHLSEAACDTLAARRPEWLGGWAEWVLAENPRSWGTVRRLVREGILPPLTGDAYISGMIGCPWPDSALAFLRRDPELLRAEVWRLFEVEGGGEDSLAARDKYSRAENTWSAALRTLAEEGALDRDRLLDASLDALQRDFAPFRAGWFSRFHETLQPTLEERAARTDRYLALLAVPVPFTVSFALKALALLDKAGKLPADRLLARASPALAAREKGTVGLALRLLDAAAKRDPALRARAACAAAEGLLHESPDIQGAVLDLIERRADPADAPLAALLRERLDALAPSQRSRLEAWLRVDTAPARSTAQESAVTDRLAERAAALPAALRELAGVDAALDAWRRGTLDLPPLELRDLRIPRLEPQRLAPVGDLDSLIALFAEVLENDGPADDAERVLDGIARLCAERPAEFDRRTAPLRKRAAALLARARGTLRDDLCRLALSWLEGKPPEAAAHDDGQLLHFLSRRILVLCVRAAARNAGPLLAAPTHSGGWIEPAALVARVRERQRLPRPDGSPVQRALRTVLGKETDVEDRFDAVQALIRLAPDGRARALEQAADLRGELGDALRYALGAEGVQVGPTPALWAAAARARSPWGDDPAVDRRHPGLGPGGALVGRPDLISKVQKSPDGKWSWHEFVLEAAPPIPEKTRLDLPGVLQYVGGSQDWRYERTPADERWCATVCPLDRAGWCAAGALILADNLDWTEAQWANKVRLEPLLDPDMHLDRMARLMLVLGVAAKEPGETGLATDVLIAAVSDGRLTGASLGESLAEALALGAPKGARLAKALAETARQSALHAETVRTALEHALAGAPEQRPADLLALLELLRELCVQAGAAIIDPGARQFIQSLSGGKSAALGKALLALVESGAAAACRQQAAALVLTGRVERLERWALRAAEP